MADGRTIAIGDIHGCATALRTLLSALELAAEDTLVVLGDAIDRGPDSRDVLDQLLAVSQSCRLVPIFGNHEQMLLDTIGGQMPLQDWLIHGGAETLDSYGPDAALTEMPLEHIDFLCTWGNYHETKGYETKGYKTERRKTKGHKTAGHFFAHGNYLPKKKLSKQPWEEMRWRSLKYSTPGPHTSGKIAVLGHTANKQGKIINLGHLVCIDTYCHGGGWLTALEPETGKVWQASEVGKSQLSALPSAP